MIMVIFGAGASYDSVPFRPPLHYPRNALASRLPLAGELFLDSGIFQKQLVRYPQCHPIVPYLQSPGANDTIESTLEKLQLRSETDVIRKRQLAAVRFYIRDVIWECQQAWDQVAAGVTNYLTLLDQLRTSVPAGEVIALVTFNYDLMIESALAAHGLKIDSLPGYISDQRYKLFKLHGSVHWGRVIDLPQFSPEILRSSHMSQVLIDNVETLDLSTQFRLLRSPATSVDGALAIFPAIAIPVQTKSGFECPSHHLDHLKTLLPSLTKIIVIGWRGTEQHFLDLIRPYFKQRVPVCVVAGDLKNSESILKHLENSGLALSAKPINGGFTEFIKQSQAEAFLQEA